MLFNSLEFLLFFPIICIVYFLLPKRQWRNGFLLIASYYFYMNWEPIYALLILFSTITTYCCGLLVEKYADQKPYKKLFLILNLLINLGILFVFKYFNFINESVFGLLETLGIRWTVPNLKLLLPVGISFYTFQAIGYSIDVYRGTIKAEHNFGLYALFVSFFPQLVAGPIERSVNLLPQFKELHPFNYDNAVEGLKQILWGYFMKLCVADRLAIYVDAIYNNVPEHNGTTLLVATLFFTIQIYCDFGGYSLIAIGAARVMGFRLMENFHRPYFAKSIKEFWSRWHISLSTWFKDYVYIPLGGNRVNKFRHLFNLFITFVVSGAWHGANWTFLTWGALHGIYSITESLLPPPSAIRSQSGAYKVRHWIRSLLKHLSCFALVAFAWIFFRANNVADAFQAVSKIFTEQGNLFINKSVMLIGIFSIFVLFIKEVIDEYKVPITFLHSKYSWVRYTSFILLCSFILLFGVFDGGQFIYFQF